MEVCNRGRTRFLIGLALSRFPLRRHDNATVRAQGSECDRIVCLRGDQMQNLSCKGRRLTAKGKLLQPVVANFASDEIQQQSGRERTMDPT